MTNVSFNGAFPLCVLNTNSFSIPDTSQCHSSCLCHCHSPCLKSIIQCHSCRLKFKHHSLCLKSLKSQVSYLKFLNIIYCPKSLNQSQIGNHLESGIEVLMFFTLIDEVLLCLLLFHIHLQHSFHVNFCD